MNENNELELTVSECNEQRVLTTQQLAESYGTTSDIINKNFNRNKDRYIEGKHYICLTGDELRDFRAKGQIDVLPNANKLYLWTEKGAFLHAKSLNTDEAWQMYDRLVEFYFVQKSKMDELPPNLRMAQMLLDQMAAQEREIREANEKSNKAIEVVGNMKNELLTPIGDWRKEINDKVRAVAYTSNIPYQELFDTMYGQLESKAHCSLDSLKRNKVLRMEKAGNTKTCIKNETTKLALIEEKPQLKEIFTNIVRQYSVKYLT